MLKRTLGAAATALLVATVGGGSALADAKKGLEIAKKVDAANAGFEGERSEIEMVLVNAYGDKTVRRMTNVIFEMDEDGDKSRIEFQWPADVKGTRMLTWSHKSDDDDQWMFLPAIKRVKRISSRNKSGSFMGSEFSYEDLGSQEVEKFKHTYVKDEKVNGRDCWVTERVPTDPRSGYSKQIVWNDKGYMNAVKIEYYDRKGELLKTGKFTGYKKVSGLWRAAAIEMTNHQTKKSSTLTWKERTLKVELDEDEFDSDELDS
ncbi:MAG: outer membrane lipoprotein-sorting protein [Myxococcota bacterium]